MDGGEIGAYFGLHTAGMHWKFCGIGPVGMHCTVCATEAAGTHWIFCAIVAVVWKWVVVVDEWEVVRGGQCSRCGKNCQ